MSTSQFDPRDSGPSGNDYIDYVVRLTLAGFSIRQPEHNKEPYYYMREQRCRLNEVIDSRRDQQYFTKKILEHYDIELPLDDEYDSTANQWIHFDMFILEDKERPSRAISIRLSNRYVGFECDLNERQRQAWLQLKLEFN